jgi:hypothetical protein
MQRSARRPWPTAITPQSGRAPPADPTRQHQPLLTIDLHLEAVHVGNIEDCISSGAPARTQATHRVRHRWRAQCGRSQPSREEFKAGIGEQLVVADVLLDRDDDVRQGAQSHGGRSCWPQLLGSHGDRAHLRQSDLAAVNPLCLAVVRPNDHPESRKQTSPESLPAVNSRLGLLNATCRRRTIRPPL